MSPPGPKDSMLEFPAWKRRRLAYLDFTKVQKTFRQAVWQPSSCVAAYIHCGPLLLRRTTDHVKLCGSRQAVWQQNTLWTAPLGENHRCRQAVWQPSSCVAANIYCGTLLWRRTTDEVKLYGSQQAVWQQKYTEDLSF